MVSKTGARGHLVAILLCKLNYKHTILYIHMYTTGGILQIANVCLAVHTPTIHPEN